MKKHSINIHIEGNRAFYELPLFEMKAGDFAIEPQSQRNAISEQKNAGGEWRMTSVPEMDKRFQRLTSEIDLVD